MERTLAALAEDLVLAHGELLEDDLGALEAHLAVLGEVPSHAVEVGLPDAHERVDGALADLERREVRQEVVADEEDEEDPVVEGALEREGERVHGRRKLDGEVLAQDGDVEEDEGLGHARCALGRQVGLGLLDLACETARVSPRELKERALLREQTHPCTGSSGGPAGHTGGSRASSSRRQRRPREAP